MRPPGFFAALGLAIERADADEAVVAMDVPTHRIATHSLNVTYASFSRERRLVRRARVASLRRSVAVAEGAVVQADGALVAKALGTFGVRRASAGA